VILFEPLIQLGSSVSVTAAVLVLGPDSRTMTSVTSGEVLVQSI
jgi:hypothetical protein